MIAPAGGGILAKPVGNHVLERGNDNAFCVVEQHPDQSGFVDAAIEQLTRNCLNAKFREFGVIEAAR